MKKISKNYSLAIIIFLITSLVFATKTEASSSSVFINPLVDNIISGEELEITLNSGNVENLYSAEFELNYDASLLEFVSADIGGLMHLGCSVPGITTVSGDGYVRINVTRLSCEGISGEGSLALIKLKSLENIGKTNILVSDLVMEDSDENIIESDSDEGFVVVYNSNNPRVVLNILDEEITEGENLEASLTVNEILNMGNLSAVINYDPSILEFTGYSEGTNIIESGWSLLVDGSVPGIISVIADNVNMGSDPILLDEPIFDDLFGDLPDTSSGIPIDGNAEIALFSFTSLQSGSAILSFGESEYDNTVTDYTTFLSIPAGWLIDSINILPLDTNPPVLYNGSPSGQLNSGTTETIVSVESDENCVCRYSETAEENYDLMTNFSNTSGTYHSFSVDELSDGENYAYYIKCADEFDNISSDYVIEFSIADQIQVNINPENITIGEPDSASLTLELINAANVGSFMSSLNYDPSILSYAGYVDGDSITTAGWSLTVEELVPGTISIIADSVDMGDGSDLPSDPLFGDLPDDPFLSIPGDLPGDLPSTEIGGAINGDAELVIINFAALSVGKSAISFSDNFGDNSLTDYDTMLTVNASWNNSEIEVLDTTQPVITLIGSSTIDLIVGDEYTELGATAIDNVDGDISDNIEITNNISTTTPGTYLVTYNVADNAGNQAEEVIRTVIVLDVSAPVCSNGLPSGSLTYTTTQTNVSLDTDEIAECRYANQADASFDAMTVFSQTSSTTHSTLISGLSSGNSYSYYVKCQDVYGNINSIDYQITFSVASAPSGGGSSGGSSGSSGGSSSGGSYSSAPAQTSTTAVSSTSSSTDETSAEATSTDDVVVMGVEEEFTDFSQYKHLGNVASSIVEEVTEYESGLIFDPGEFVELNDVTSGLYNKIVPKNSELNDNIKFAIANFIHNGTPTTLSLGAGERAGVLNSYISVFGKYPQNIDEWKDVIKIANGRWPTERNLEAEEAAKTIHFKKVYQREPNMNNPHDNAAVTVITYGLRPAIRNLDSEKTAIKTFKAIYGYAPESAIDWDIVRAIAYSGATR